MPAASAAAARAAYWASWRRMASPKVYSATDQGRLTGSRLVDPESSAEARAIRGRQERLSLPGWETAGPSTPHALRASLRMTSLLGSACETAGPSTPLPAVASLRMASLVGDACETAGPSTPLPAVASLRMRSLVGDCCSSQRPHWQSGWCSSGDWLRYFSAHSRQGQRRCG
jgi:hypothetical protein